MCACVHSPGLCAGEVSRCVSCEKLVIATLLIKQLSAHPQANFGPGTGPIYLTRVACTGSESEVGLCAYSTVGDTSGCTHSRDVGVACTGR